MEQAADHASSSPGGAGSGGGTPRPAPAPRGFVRRNWRWWLRLAGRGSLYALLGAVAAGGLVLAWLWPRCEGKECPSVERLRDYRPPEASLVYDRDGGLLA